MTTTIDMRPEPFVLPFFYTQLDILAKNRLRLWQEHRRILGEGSVFAWHTWGMVRNSDGEMEPTCDSGLYITSDIAKPLHDAKDFAEYHQRHADEHGGLNVEDCWEFGNAKDYDGGDIQPRSLLYGMRLSFNDGSVLFFRMESKLKEELNKKEL